MPRLSPARAAATLRAAYLVMFLTQAAVAGVIALLARWLSGFAARPNALLGWVLVVLALAELPFGAVLVALAQRRPGRQAALSGALLVAVVLSTPAWFLALALATGQRGLPLAALLGVLALAYGLGALLVGRLGRNAAAEVVPEQRAAA